MPTAAALAAEAKDTIGAENVGLAEAIDAALADCPPDANADDLLDAAYGFYVALPGAPDAALAYDVLEEAYEMLDLTT